jgi:acetyl esterase/lipase
MRSFAFVVLLAASAAFAPATMTVPAHAQAPAITTKTDVVYGRVQGSALLADLAYPSAASTAKRPALVYVHGGRWRSGTRIDDSWKNVSKWTEDGYFTMTVEYRLVGGSPAPASYEDTLCAIRWLHTHAAEYNVDPDRIYLIGFSSGGHLVTLAASLGDGPFKRAGGWDDARTDVRAVIATGGAYDLNNLSWGNLWTPAAGDAVEARRLASPLHQVTPKSRPMMIVHSDDDKSVPVQQAHDMVKALAAAGVKHRFLHYKDRGHMGATEEVLKEVKGFIAEVERGGD